MFTIQYVKELQWDNAEHTSFSCVVKYEEFNEEMPASANATDPYAHIHEIWTNGIAGEYGEIAEFEPEPIPPIVPPSAEQNKEKAVRLLQESDWTATESIADPQISNPYLTNQADFLAYRSALRAIAVDPQEGFITWPTRPDEVWSSQ
jgi:hypothetical protein